MPIALRVILSVVRVCMCVCVCVCVYVCVRVMLISIEERTSVERNRSMCWTPARSTCAERLSSYSICLIIVYIIFVVNVFVCVCVRAMMETLILLKLRLTPVRGTCAVRLSRRVNPDLLNEDISSQLCAYACAYVCT